MTDFKFESEEVENPETVSEFSMEDYEKYRIKSSKITIDVSIINTENRDEDAYIEERKDELKNNQTDVPHPYKPEKTEKGGKDKIIDFQRNPFYGKGLANAEYDLISDDEDEIIRYTYIVTWKHFDQENKLAEIELYLPTNLEYEDTEALAIAETLKLKE